MDARARLPALPRRRTHLVGDGQRRSRHSHRHSVRPPAGSLARVQSARAVVEFHESVARRPLVVTGYRLVPNRRRLCAAGACRAQPRAMADQFLQRRDARHSGLARLAVRLCDPGAPRFRRTERTAWHFAPWRRGDSHGDTVVHPPGTTPCRRYICRRAAAAVRGVR